MSSFTIQLTFHGDLPFFLGRKASTIERQLSEKTSVKDVIEACGVPHTEVDLILVNGEPVDFAAILTQDVAVDIYPVESWNYFFHRKSAASAQYPRVCCRRPLGQTRP